MALNDPETCSWCTTEVENDSLIEVPERLGSDCARICTTCANTRELSIEHSLMSDTESLFRPLCPTRVPELHELGEFPMTCYRCHMEADS